MIQSILVLGGGSAGFLTAITLKGRLPAVNVTVVRSKEIGIIGVGEGTTITVPSHLHGYLGLDPGAFLRESKATLKLGIRFFWGERPHFDYGFQQALDVRPAGLSKPAGFYAARDMEDFAMYAALMARDRVFPRDGRGLPAVSAGFAYHIENEAFVTWLENVARRIGVQVADGSVSQVRRQNDVVVEKLILEDGRELTADLFVDASGFRSVLLGEALGEKYIGFSSSLWCERAVVGGWERSPQEPIRPYTTAETMDAGWSWRIDHESRINRGYVYCPGYISDEAAEQEFRMKNPRVGPTRVIRFRSGRRECTWVGNVVAIGNAFGFVEPLEATSLASICQAAQNLGELLFAADCTLRETQRSVFNTLQARTLDSIRWFLSIHYKFNGRLQTPFWRETREKVNIDGASEIVAYYNENGPSALFREALLDLSNPFGVEGYLVMLMGLNAPCQRQYHPGPRESEIWERYRGSFRQAAENGCSVGEALERLRSPNWQWQRNMFSAVVASAIRTAPV